MPDPPIISTSADGVHRVVWPERTYRYLFDDGRTVDVVTARDDSTMRGALLDHFRAERIAGSVELPDAPTLPGVE